MISKRSTSSSCSSSAVSSPSPTRKLSTNSSWGMNYSLNKSMNRSTPIIRPSNLAVVPQYQTKSMNVKKKTTHQKSISKITYQKIHNGPSFVSSPDSPISTISSTNAVNCSNSKETTAATLINMKRKSTHVEVYSPKRHVSPGRSIKRKAFASANNINHSGLTGMPEFSAAQEMFYSQNYGGFFFLGQFKRNGFIVAEQINGSKYKVTIGSQECSCQKRKNCSHLEFVMRKVLEFDPNDARLNAQNLTDNEVSSLMKKFHTRISNSSLQMLSVENEICQFCFNNDTTSVLDDHLDDHLVKCNEFNCPGYIAHNYCWEFWLSNRIRDQLCPSCQAIKYLGGKFADRKKSNRSYSLIKTGWKEEADCYSNGNFPWGNFGLATWGNDEDFECGGLNSEIPLPQQTQPISERHWSLAQGWSGILGRHIVACLVSKDWGVRDQALRRLSREVANTLRSTHFHDQSPERNDRKLWRCTAEVLVKSTTEKVCKVYLTALKCLRTLLVFTKVTDESHIHMIKHSIKPVIHGIMAKCADGNRRLAELSIDTILELSRGTKGKLGLGRYAPGDQTSTHILGIDFILQMVLEESGGVSAPGTVTGGSTTSQTCWQSVLGRLTILEEMLKSLRFLFTLPNDTLQSTPIYQTAEYYRIMVLVDFSFRHLTSSHPNVSKRSRNIFVDAVKLSTTDKDTFAQIIDLISVMDPTLQLRIRRRLKVALGVTPIGGDSQTICSTETMMLVDKHLVPQKQNTTSINDKPFRLNRSISHSPSRIKDRSSSQSPSRFLNRKLTGGGFQPRSSPIYSRKNQSNSSSPQRRRRLISASSSSLVSPISSVPSSVPEIPIVAESSSFPEWATARSREFEVALPFVPGLSDTSYLNSWLYPTMENEKIMSYHLPDSCIKEERNQLIDGSHYSEGIDWTKSVLLGAGAYSSCYQACDIRTGTIMAVKQIPIHQNMESNSSAEENSQLAKEEVRLLLSLQHPHVIRMFGAVAQQNHINVFVEWMAGGSVANLLDRFGPFSLPVIKNFIFQALLGVEYLHECGVLHRDLKGANLLVDNTGHYLRIGDFGSATRMSTLNSIGGEFKGQLQGTIAFMAPEVLRGENYGRSCDIWSLGCCIIEMATARPPWNVSAVSNHWALIYKIACSSKPPSVPENLCPDLRSIVTQCLQSIPNQRPTAKQLCHHPAFLDS